MRRVWFAVLVVAVGCMGTVHAWSAEAEIVEEATVLADEALSAEPEMKDSGTGWALKIGTLGLGLDISLGIQEWLNFRGGADYLDFVYKGTYDDIDFDVSIAYLTFMALLDVHPFRNNFRISGGAVFGDNGVTLDSVPTEPERIGNTEYPAELLGTLTGDVTFEGFAPYAGIGYGNAVGQAGNWSFSFDLGVIFQSYEVDFSASGPANLIPGFKEDLALEEKDLEEDLDHFNIYPVLMFGVGYRF